MPVVTTNDDLMARALDAMASSRAHQDPDYPRFHLAAPVGRLNDPNGLLIRDGEYHAFYQFGPFHPEKTVYWGHASSRDLITWRQHEPAIAPGDWYDRNGAYSGGAFFEGPRAWLHYTGNVKTADGAREAYQCAVVSDDLVTFTKHPGNPLIAGLPDGYTAHLRDPQIHRDGDDYLMLLGAQRTNETGCLLTYRSRDLAAWEFTGELTFGALGDRFDDFGYMWECPNLVRVYDDVRGEERDVLIFCPQGVSEIGDNFQNVFPCGYLAGRLEGTVFHTDGDFVELDRGFEFYAPQVFRAGPGAEPGPPILLGWMGNAAQDDHPSLTHGWVHMLTAPRYLSLRDGVLHQRPALQTRVDRPLAVSGATLGMEPLPIDELTGADAFWLALEVDRDAAADVTLTLGSSDTSRALITLSADALTVDRSATRYSVGERRTIALPEPLRAGENGSGRLRIDLLHDRSATELFLGDGLVAFSMRTYLDLGVRNVTLAASGAAGVIDARAVLLDHDRSGGVSEAFTDVTID